MYLTFLHEQKILTTQPALQTKGQMIMNNHLVLINGKLQDILCHPLKAGLRPGPQTLDETIAQKMGLKEKAEPKRNKNSIPKQTGLLEKEPPKILIQKQSSGGVL